MAVGKVLVTLSTGDRRQGETERRGPQATTVFARCESRCHREDFHSSGMTMPLLMRRSGLPVSPGRGELDPDSIPWLDSVLSLPPLPVVKLLKHHARPKLFFELIVTNTFTFYIRRESQFPPSPRRIRRPGSEKVESRPSAEAPLPETLASAGFPVAPEDRLKDLCATIRAGPD